MKLKIYGIEIESITSWRIDITKWEVDCTMKVDKFKILCRTSDYVWQCLDGVYDSLEQAVKKCQTSYDAWDTAIVQIKVMQKKSLDYIDEEEEACQD